MIEIVRATDNLTAGLTKLRALWESDNLDRDDRRYIASAISALSDARGLIRDFKNWKPSSEEAKDWQ